MQDQYEASDGVYAQGGILYASIVGVKQVVKQDDVGKVCLLQVHSQTAQNST